MQGLLFGSPFVTLRSLETAAESHGPLGGKEFEVREEAADTIEYSGLDFLLVMQLDQVLATPHPVLGVQLAKN